MYKKEYLFYDYGEGKVIERIPLVADAYDWEEEVDEDEIRDLIDAGLVEKVDE